MTDTISQDEALKHLETLIGVAMEADQLDHVQALLMEMAVIVRKAKAGRKTIPVYGTRPAD